MCLENLMKSAEKGNHKAQYKLAVKYKKGKDVEKSLEKAVELFKKSAEQGNNLAQHELAICYLNGICIEKSKEKAAELFEKAHGIGYMQKIEKDLKKHLSAAEKGDNKDLLELAYFYDTTDAVEDAAKKAEEVLERIIEKEGLDDPDVLYDIAMFFLESRSIENSEEKSIKFFDKAAEQGNAWSQWYMAQRYADGYGVEQSLEKAVELYEKAAEGGLTEAQIDIAGYYRNGIGVPKDLEKAKYWQKKAEEDHSPVITVKPNIYLGDYWQNQTDPYSVQKES